ncbi:MAG: GatB/YqeY domain-containing protein [Bacteroidia bacterium]
MSLTERINNDIKSAMLAKEKEKLEALRAIKAALIIEATKEGGDGSVSEDAEISILKKLYKQRVDAASIFNQQNRSDLAQVEEFQAKIIEAYLPEQMDEVAVRKVVEETVTQMGAVGPQDMGKVMGSVMGKLKGKADGSLISSVVKSVLNK